MYLHMYFIIRASGEVRAEGPNRDAQRTLGKMGIKIQPSAPLPPLMSWKINSAS